MAMFWASARVMVGDATMTFPLSISSAQARSMKRADITASNRKAYAKAKARAVKKWGKAFVAIENFRCVG